MLLAEYIKNQDRGTQARMAEAIKAHAPDVSNWVNDPARQIPPAKCVAIERFTSGTVTVEELRPDLRWVRVRRKLWPHPSGYPTLDVSEARP